MCALAMLALGGIVAVAAGEAAKEGEEGVMVRRLSCAGALVLVVLPTACSVGLKVIVASGAVQCWGSNGFGQLGNAPTAGATGPRGVFGLSSVTIVSAGAYHTCAVDSATVKCWGLNDNGQVGRLANNTKANPQPSPNVPLGF